MHTHNPSNWRPSGATILEILVTRVDITRGSTSSPRAEISAPPSKYLPNGPLDPTYERRVVTSTSRDNITDSTDDKRYEGEPPTGPQGPEQASGLAAVLGPPWRATSTLRVTVRDLWYMASKWEDGMGARHFKALADPEHHRVLFVVPQGAWC